MKFAGLLVRREFVFLLLAVCLGLGAATAYWISRATVLTIAVAPKDGTEPALIRPMPMLWPGGIRKSA